MDILLYVLAAVLVVIGLAGAILPALPGVPILYAGLWLAAAVDGYHHVGFWWLIIIGLIGALAMLLDLVASVFGAKRVGATPAALWGSAIGTVIGLFFGLPGLLLGPFAGALAGELTSGSSVLRSTHVGVGTWIGLLLGTLAKLVLSFVMLALFAFAMLW
ncbi:DUF456 family protein [Oleiagrimonas sp. MCCC 1A03011]|uniref:DUF456 domain-containing protein n=1 Tax=Oleiagrimonas sp. MCCC 1A03011 TaxID=1926883 RepID=UPI000DC5DA75|nr:DUF456 family protein [Oleiagrimonas sp. MCCC 1A03011]RAP58622.1 hypothetical protein BTJ49_05275 [Oleiagrimonas sp. MCCC 1A03011]